MPFAQPTATETPAAPAVPAQQRRKFGQPGQSSWFKPLDHFGELLLITPKSVQAVTKPPRNPQDTPKVIDQLTADVVVLDGPKAGTVLKGVWIEQDQLVKAGKRGLDSGEDVLGRLFRFPQRAVKTVYPDRHALEQGMQTWRSGQPNEPKYAWGLENFTDEDAAVADAYLSGVAPTPAAVPAAPADADFS